MAGEGELSVQGVSKHFGGVMAVNRISMSVNQGEIVSVIGPNGAGKTTLLNMISGFYHPDQGTITMQDMTRPILPPAVLRLLVARTFQNIALFRGMTHNMMLGRHVHMRSGC